MADGSTSFLGLIKPEIGGSENDWGDKLNANFDAIDALFEDVDDALKKTFAGNPNGSVAGDYVGQTLWDSTNQKQWTCKTAGSAASAVWRETGGWDSGRRLVFPLATSTPVDFVIDTTSALNNAALRLVTGLSGGTGGTVGFTSLFGGTTGDHALATDELPPHVHAAPIHTHGPGSFVDTAATNGIVAGVTILSVPVQFGSGGNGNNDTGGELSITRPISNGAIAGTSAPSAAADTGSTGGGSSHAHTIGSLKYLDAIVGIHN